VTIDRYRPLFLEHDIEIVLPVIDQQMSESELLEIIEDYDGIIAGDDEFTAAVLKKAIRLKALARWGVGVDGVDLEAAGNLGIKVSNTPGVFSDEVGDLVMGYIVLLARQLHTIDHGVRSGEWTKFQGSSLRGKMLGVIGVGDIGRAVATRGKAFGMRIAGFDVAQAPGTTDNDIGIKFTDLDELLSTSDYISLNCNLTDSNRHMLGKNEFKFMKPGTYIINAARGPLIDEDALVAALKDGIVAGAALDVFESEPLPLDSPLREFDSCIFGSHNGSNTLEAVLRVNDLSIANLIDGLQSAADDSNS
jgi:D-3-phosphoglycerate dehydrogenase